MDKEDNKNKDREVEGYRIQLCSEEIIITGPKGYVDQTKSAEADQEAANGAIRRERLADRLIIVSGIWKPMFGRKKEYLLSGAAALDKSELLLSSGKARYSLTECGTHSACYLDRDRWGVLSVDTIYKEIEIIGEAYPITGQCFCHTAPNGALKLNNYVAGDTHDYFRDYNRLGIPYYKVYHHASPLETADACLDQHELVSEKNFPLFFEVLSPL